MQKKQKRSVSRSTTYWTVGGRDYRLKLKASTIGKLENKYKQNIMNMIDDMPPLCPRPPSYRLQWSRGGEHGMDYSDVQTTL